MKIRGKTIIELNDAKTGKLVQRTEDNNMLTNALTQMYAHGGMTNPTIFNASAIRSDALTQMLGGILLLDTPLTENANIVRVPKGIRMVANGAKGVLNSDSPTEFGSWNGVESGWQNDGSYKMVWDWTTSQGNGTITTVCLSSYYGGYCGIGNRSGGTKSGNEAISTYNSYYTKNVSNLIGALGNKVYRVEEVRGVTEWAVKEYEYAFTKVDIRDNYSLRETDSFVVSIPETIKNLTSKYYAGGYRPYGYRGMYQSGNIANIFIAPMEDGNYWLNAYIARYNVSTKQIVDVITITFDEDLSEENYGGKFGFSDKWFLWNGVAVELENLTNKIELGAMSGRFYPVSSDVFYGGSQIVDMDLEEIQPINANGNVGNVGIGNNELLRWDAGEIVRDPRYIATINNLESAVTKDASKTMKVTYVLRFDQQEGE